MQARFYGIAALVWAVDHLTKKAVHSSLAVGDGWDIIPGFLRIAYVRNTGVAFGLFADVESAWKPYVLAAMAVVAVGVIVVYSYRMSTPRVLLQLALAVTLGGILGNFVDRAVHGYVVDFIEVHIRDVFHWPTFNVADSAITIGIALLLLDTLRHPAPEEKPGTAE